MQKHHAQSHHWVNPRGKGRPLTEHLSVDPVPWIEGVACQRFFPSREGSRWFQVSLQIKKQKTSESKTIPALRKPRPPFPNLTPKTSTHLRQVIEREEGYQNALNQPRITSKDTGNDTFATTSLWLNRSRWPSIYQGARRDILRALTRLPDRRSLAVDYTLGQGVLDRDPDFVSLHEDEEKISCIIGAFDSVIDRCEDTVRYTSHNLLCWLLSSRLHTCREISSELVAEKASEVRYRRTEKQLLAFTFRIYLMSSDSRQDVTSIKLSAEISAQLDHIWNHKIWNLIDMSKGIWPAIKRQDNDLTDTFSSPVASRSDVDACDISYNGLVHDYESHSEDEEDEEDNESDVEDWDPEEGENDYDDSGYYSDIDGTSNELHSYPLTGVVDEFGKATSD